MSRTSPPTGLEPCRYRPIDIIHAGVAAVRGRPVRTMLSALGVSIGIAAPVGVVGLSASSRADLEAQLDELGTDLLTVEPGGAVGAAGGDARLAADADAMVDRIGPVTQVAAVTTLPDVTVRRSGFVDPTQTSGISVTATDTQLLETMRGTISSGRWFDTAAADYPTVVLGSVAAERLGVIDLDTANLHTASQVVLLDDEPFTVVGVLEPFPFAADLDRTAFVGEGIAHTLFDVDDSPTRVYLRVAETSQIDGVRAVLPATANPESPQDVAVSRPSDALSAQLAAETTFNALFLGLGAVALVVGGVGIANVMVIAVIERRGEIGLQRALGATRAHISRQFLAEAVTLALLGGLAGVVFGGAITAAFAHTQQWAIVIPPVAVAAGVAAAVVVGAIAGLYPAIRAARLAPTDALRTA